MSHNLSQTLYYKDNKLYLSNYMMAYEITNVLQSQYVESGIVDFNFQCSVFDQGMTNSYYI